MKTRQFEKTLQSLRGDSYRSTIIGLGVVLTLLAAWTAWFVLARVPVFAETAEARLAVAREAVPVESLVDGQLVGVEVEVGQPVEAGQALFEIATDLERGRTAEEMARLAGLREQLAAVRREIGARSEEGEARIASALADLAASRARRAAAEARERLAASDLQRGEALAREDLLSSSELDLLRTSAEQRRAEAEAEAEAIQDLGYRVAAAERELAADLARLEKEAAGLESEVEVAERAVDRLRTEVGRGTVRAAMSGVVAELAMRRIGSRVEAGEHLASLLPNGELRAVAEFSPADALGRIRPGQGAELRLDGFPWAEFGVLRAKVSEVAAEPRNGTVRVELELVAPETFDAPLVHGLPATAVIRVDQASPLSLLLRSIGARSRRSLQP